jgi:hypothetical protein
MSGATSDETTDDGEQEIPGPNEMYCPHCSEITPRGGVICGHCGGPMDNNAQSRVSPAKWERWGEKALNYSFLAAIFGPVAVYCGLKLRQYDEERGLYYIKHGLIYTIILAIVLVLAVSML